MKKSLWVSTVCLAALGAGGTAQAYGPAPTPNWGDIHPFMGDINPFYGDINPFYGDINPFYGDISPFWGDISPFWGDISPFYGDINPFYGDINPFWGDISPFAGPNQALWGDIAPFWGDIGPFWGQVNASWGDIQPWQTAQDLQSMFAQAEGVFGSAVTSATGLTFDAGFVDPLLAQYGIDLNNPSSLQNLDQAGRAAFFMDFYDGLMNFSGADRADHWMATVNWRPILTQDLRQGDDAVIGLLDTGVNTNNNGWTVPFYTGGYADDVTGHGQAVASLLVDPHDGTGVMGIAPHASVALYNPFDHTGTAGWNDIKNGVRELTQAGASVINMSLGVPGFVFHQDMADVFSHNQVEFNVDDVSIVLAAGNDGVAQASDVTMTTQTDVISNLIFVGSVDPNGNISAFSNRPGQARICTSNNCASNVRLMDRFLVAPGELILTSDGNGGTTRYSGTSFAAPIVSGAVALVQGRWAWWQQHPEVVADLLFATATDLGAPGVDEVYGNGLLNIEAALSPLDWDALDVHYHNGSSSNLGSSLSDAQISSTQLRNLVLNPGMLSLAAASNDYIVAFETFNGVMRDFNIPLSDALYGQDLTYQGYNERAQSYLYDRMVDWANGGGGSFAFGDRVNLASAPLSQRVDLTVTLSQPDPYDLREDNELAFHTGFMLRNDDRGVDLRFGSGEAALAFSQGGAFGFYSDHRPETGGVNPILGFASGDAYVMGGMDVGARTRLSIGMTANQERSSLSLVLGDETVSDYEAFATVFGVAHEITPFLRANASYTHLEEETGYLGGQGGGAFNLGGGTGTDSVTLGLDADLRGRLTLSASVTAAHTAATQFEDSALSLSDGGVTATAFQVSTQRTGLFGDFDAARFSVLQPLHVESGSLTYAGVEVVDRDTGEIGVVEQTWSLGGDRPLVAEALYATPIMSGRAQFSAFARGDLAGSTHATGEAAATLGLRFSGRF